MVRLEDIVVGSSVRGIETDCIVEVVAVKWYAESAIEVTYKKPNGKVDSQLLYRDSEPNLVIEENALPWSFTADSVLVKLASEAYRIHLAHLFDPYLAVHTSLIEPLPHQITAVYEAMLPRQPLRFVLADDPGAGKTIMTGLLIKELMIRGDVKRCLIVAPGNLVEQWQDELYEKFHIHFDIITNERIDSAVGGNIFNEVDLCIARLDKLARSESVQEKLHATEWDLIVVDEAHKMSASIWGGDIRQTKRYQLGKLLSEITRHFLLLTATPHNGKEEEFQLFMSLVDPDRFEGVGKAAGKHPVDVSDVMRRLVKEELLRFDGTPLFPERIAHTVNYDLSLLEDKLYQEVTNYVQEEFNRADRLKGDRKTTVGFALTVLQRRLASSPEAIYQSLNRRRQRLERRLADEELKHQERAYVRDGLDDFDDIDDMPAEELENIEDAVADQASAAQTIEELRAEIDTLKHLERMAETVRNSGQDRKWDELSKLLQDNEYMYGSDGKREKLIIFTEHKDTLKYLQHKIESLLGDPESVVVIHGGMTRDDRRNAEARFKQDSRVRVMVATDAAGEGINLQSAHLMINYDLPWNPNRLEQRFGRIHRIGQTEVCHLWNLVANQTREGMVFQRLFDKLEQERKALGGKVFDVLGKVSFGEQSLRDLLLEAIRYGNKPEVRAKLRQVVDDSLDREALNKLINEHALTHDILDQTKVDEVREDMERAEARRLQPHFIESFFLEAFKYLGGRINPREHGRYQITHVPQSVWNCNSSGNFSERILNQYERVCFDKEYCDIPGKAQADLICPGHPLLEAVVEVIRKKGADAMKQGCILVDEQDLGEDPRLLFYIESTIQDAAAQPGTGRRTISQELHFIEIDEAGNAVNAGYAPYLDYAVPSDDDRQAVLEYLTSQSWLNADIEHTAKDYATINIVPRHLQSVKNRRLAEIDKTEKAVEERLTAAIQYWDHRAYELKKKEEAGKNTSSINSYNATQRANELEERKKTRLDELEQEKHISAAAPVITGGALVVPLGFLNHLHEKEPDSDLISQHDLKKIEYAGMMAVEAVERQLGHIPKDVSKENRGYDIESLDPETHDLFFIEVKGHTVGSPTVTVTKNEIFTSLNDTGGYIFAIVEVNETYTKTTYIKHPFHREPEFTVTRVDYDIDALLKNQDILLEEEQPRV